MGFEQSMVGKIYGRDAISLERKNEEMMNGESGDDEDERVKRGESEGDWLAQGWWNEPGSSRDKVMTQN